MGMIILLFYVIPYLAVSTVVMVIAIKCTKRIWIRGIVAAVLFLIPTYDIIITNILGAYYCATAPKAFIKETVEYPQSIYFEDSIQPFTENDINNTIRHYLDGVHLKRVAFNLSGKDVVIYWLDEVSEQYQYFLNLNHTYKKAREDEENTRKDMYKKLNNGIIKRQSEEHGMYVKAINLKEQKSEELSKERYEVWQKLIRKAITTKDKMPNLNYSYYINEIKLDKFVAKFLYAFEIKSINNKTNEMVGFDIHYKRFFYNIFPDLVGRYFVDSFGCGMNENLYIKIFNMDKWGTSWASVHRKSLSQYLYNKYVQRK